MTGLSLLLEKGFESDRHYHESMKDFDRVLDYLDRSENISEERKELFHQMLDQIGMNAVFELARDTNKLFKELEINSYKLQQDGHLRLMFERSEGLNSVYTPQLLDTLEEKVKESIGKGHYSNKVHVSDNPSWDYVTTEFNEETGLNFSKSSLRQAHRKHNLNRNEE